MASDGGNVQNRLAKAEHIGPEDTGDNISAKKTANYVWTGVEWARMTQPGGGFAPISDYDYLDVQQTSSSVETYVFKTGGSGGSPVRTVVVTYTDSTKENLDTVTWS